MTDRNTLHFFTSRGSVERLEICSVNPVQDQMNLFRRDQVREKLLLLRGDDRDAIQPRNRIFPYDMVEHIRGLMVGNDQFRPQFCRQLMKPWKELRRMLSIQIMNNILFCIKVAAQRLYLSREITQVIPGHILPL